MHQHCRSPVAYLYPTDITSRMLGLVTLGLWHQGVKLQAVFERGANLTARPQNSSQRERWEGSHQISRDVKGWVGTHWTDGDPPRSWWGGTTGEASAPECLRILFLPATERPCLWLSPTCREFHVSTCASYLSSEGPRKWFLSLVMWLLPAIHSLVQDLVQKLGLRQGKHSPRFMPPIWVDQWHNSCTPWADSCFQEKDWCTPQRPLSPCLGLCMALLCLPRAGPGPRPSPAAPCPALKTHPGPARDE